jgi:hypothetical protein
MPKKNKSRNKKKTKKQIREENYFQMKKETKKQIRKIKQNQKKFKKGEIEEKKTKQKKSLQNIYNSLSKIRNIKPISFSNKGLTNSNNITFEVPNLLNSHKENTRIFIVSGHSSYNYRENIDLEEKYTVLKDDVFKDQKFKNFRHLMLHSFGNVIYVLVTYILANIINLYPNFYKKIIECSTLKEAKKLDYYFLKYINKKNEKLINKYFHKMIIILYRSKDKITNFKVFPNDKLFLPKRNFNFLNFPKPTDSYFGFSLMPYGIYDITKNNNNDFFIFSDEINNIFFEQIIESELNLENFIKYIFRIPDEITKTKLINLGEEGIQKLEFLEKKCNLNKILFERYNNVVKDLINKGIIIEDYINYTSEVPNLVNSDKKKINKKKDLENKKEIFKNKNYTIKSNFDILNYYCQDNNILFSTKEIYHMIYNSLNNLDENILFIDCGCIGFPEEIKWKDIDLMKKNHYWLSSNGVSPINKPNKYNKRVIKGYQGHFMPSEGRTSTNIKSHSYAPPKLDSYGNFI